MNRRTKIFWSITTIFFGFYLLFSVYFSEAIELSIVDADTGKPLRGVIVTANWATERGTIGATIPIGQLWVMEAVSDESGHISFPARGPAFAFWGSPANYDPQLLIFKPGFRYERLFNSSEQNGLSIRRRSQWNRKTIRLKRFDGDMQEYAEHLLALDNRLEFARYGRNCEWQKIPRMLVSLDQQSDYLSSKGVKLKGWQIGAKIRKVTDVDRQKSCGSAEEYFKDFVN